MLWDVRFLHPSFSTLQIHQTSAFSCNICGRRFGVLSNLNRHTRRCLKKTEDDSRYATSVKEGLVNPSNRRPRMAREQANPNIRRVERERAGYVTDEDEETANRNANQRPRTDLGQSAIMQQQSGAPLVHPPPAHPGAGPIGDGESTHEPVSHPGPALVNTIRETSSVEGASSSSSSSSDNNPSVSGTERRAKRPRRAPSPSRWVPASLQNFSLSPTFQRTSAPLPPVVPNFDPMVGPLEERNSYSRITDENTNPAGGLAECPEGFIFRSRAERFELAPYHPCGWTGVLPGPAVVTDVTNFTKSNWRQKGFGSGGGSKGDRHGAGAGSAGYLHQFCIQ